MSIQGQIDSTFTTEQRDMFASGIVAEIGVNAYAVWHGIKFFADFNTGEAFPGMRLLGKKLGLSQPTVQRATQKLIDAKMLRVVKGHSKQRGQTYIARERISVTVGKMTLCTIVLDYVPEHLRSKLKRIGDALQTGESFEEVFAEVEIIPGEGMQWDPETKTLKGRMRASELPLPDHRADEFHRAIGEKFLQRILPKK